MTRLIYLRGGFVSGSVARMAGVPAPAVGGRGGQGESDQESFPFAEHVTTLRIRVREVSRNGMRSGEWAAQLNLKNRADPGGQECGSGMRPPRFPPTWLATCL